MASSSASSAATTTVLDEMLKALSLTTTNTTAAAAAVAVAASDSIGPCCFHGSTSDHFPVIYVPRSRDSGAPDQNKSHWYYRAIVVSTDDRGFINCLWKETKTFCDCMKDKKTEAEGMEKLDMCDGCKRFVPRKGR